MLALGGVAVLAANCSTSPGGGGSTYDAQQRREIGSFTHKKYGVASPRVVADGEPVPQGGGRYHVGKPYRVAGRTYVPTDRPRDVVGMASWYGAAFHGRKTANGEVFDRQGLTAAHPTMPLPSYARVTNLGNSRSIIVRVNDRGPFHGGRVVDVSQRVADALDFRRFGTARVKVEYVGPAGIGGSDDRRLYASLRTDGQPAALGGRGLLGTMVASSEEPAPRPSPVAVVQPRADERPAFPAQAPAAGPRPSGQPAILLAGPPPPGSRIVRGVPLPPDRPYDLVTIPGAGVPVAASDGVVLPERPALFGAPPRRQVAAMSFFASPEFRPARFVTAERAFAALAIDRFTAEAPATGPRSRSD